VDLCRAASHESFLHRFTNYLEEGREGSHLFEDTGNEMNSGNTNPELNEGHFMFPPKTHDTSRIGWHMKDLECFAKSIETVSCSCCQNRILICVRQSALPFQIMEALDTVR
jgi:hypothetical protein